MHVGGQGLENVHLFKEGCEIVAQRDPGTFCCRTSVPAQGTLGLPELWHRGPALPETSGVRPFVLGSSNYARVSISAIISSAIHPPAIMPAPKAGISTLQ